MIADEVFVELGCCFSNDRHYVKTPIVLPCGHCVCENCIKNSLNNLICKICNKISNQKVKTACENKLVKKTIQKHLNTLVEALLKKFNDSTRKLNGKYINLLFILIII